MGLSRSEQSFLDGADVADDAAAERLAAANKIIAEQTAALATAHAALCAAATLWCGLDLKTLTFDDRIPWEEKPLAYVDGCHKVRDAIAKIEGRADDAGHVDGRDVLARLAECVRGWPGLLPPARIVAVRADLVTSAYAEIEKLRGERS
jgi:hypothetical protein